jgi:hypothetical protein
MAALIICLKLAWRGLAQGGIMIAYVIGGYPICSGLFELVVTSPLSWPNTFFLHRPGIGGPIDSTALGCSNVLDTAQLTISL